jgi:hypothetical protein
MKSLPMDLSSFLTINFLLADIVSSATLTDQPVVPSASTSQRREIALKQVGFLTLILYFTDHFIIKQFIFFFFLGTRFY